MNSSLECPPPTRLFPQSQRSFALLIVGRLKNYQNKYPRSVEARICEEKILPIRSEKCTVVNRRRAQETGKAQYAKKKIGFNRSHTHTHSHHKGCKFSNYEENFTVEWRLRTGATRRTEIALSSWRARRCCAAHCIFCFSPAFLVTNNDSFL